MKIIKIVMIFYDGGKRQRDTRTKFFNLLEQTRQRNPSSKSFIKTKQKNKKCTRHKKSERESNPPPKTKKNKKSCLI